MEKELTIAIAGIPNSGKTTMFNMLTGALHRVGNYPGVTVEKRQGLIKNCDSTVHAVDLPGTYSLTAYSQEELVARTYLVEERPDVVIDVLNAGSLERNLYLAVQLLELGIPVVLALNMMDEVRRQGRRIDTGRLSGLLGVPVVETVARTGEGRHELIEQSRALARQRSGAWQPLVISYGPDLDPVLDDMTRLIESKEFLTDRFPARWTALKYLERDRELLKLGSQTEPTHAQLEKKVAAVSDHCLSTLDAEPESIIADYRYGYISALMRQGVISADDGIVRRVFSDRLDVVLTHAVAGPAIMVLTFYIMFQVTFKLGELPMAWLGALFGWLGDQATGLLPSGLLQSLVVSGLIDGVGGVLGFVPLIMIMFMIITVLEDSGYMARMAYMLDRVLRIFGLHGCSVMPFIISGGIAGGCAVPGIMAARTLRSPKEKIATLLTAPFMACGAKVPVFILLSAAFFRESAATAMFCITMGGWVAALIVSLLLRKTIIRGDSTPFVMELPPYRLPTLRGICIHTVERVWQYVKKAGTVILAISVLLWAAMTFPQLPQHEVERFDTARTAIAVESSNGTAAALRLDNEQAQAGLRYSLAGRAGIALESITSLAGFDWRTNIALVGGIAAKEVIISTLGTAYSLGAVETEETESLGERLAGDSAWSPLTAACLMIFVLLYSPCFVALVVMAREASWKWAVFSMVFNTVFAFAVVVLVYQVGSRIM